MRLIDLKTLRQFWTKHADAREKLTRWYQTAQKASWQNLNEVRKIYPHADAVTVKKSGNTATVFNICGNKYRLITAIHYNRQIIFLMMVLTHKEYSTNKWKDFFMNTTKRVAVKDCYLDLVKQHPLVPIKTEAQYDRAAAFLKKLAIRDEFTLNDGESSYLEALTLFVEDYQNKHHQLAAKEMSPLAALKYLMEESEMSPADLGRILGNRSLASQILLSNRELSKANIIALAKYFHVNASLFLTA